MKKEEWEKVEHAFFEIDEQENIAKIVLRYDSPEDLFEHSCVSETPLLSQETQANIQNVFSLVPSKYKIDLTLRFADFGSYTEEKLMDTVIGNFVLELKRQEAETKKRTKRACDFMAAGILSFLFMFITHCLWAGETVWSELLFYLLDIAATVSLYEAVTILSLERREKLAELKTMHDHFSAIHFEKRAD